MGVFYTDCRIANVQDESRATDVPHVLVDTGAEASWIDREVLSGIGVVPRKKDQRFRMANGEVITRSVGFAVIHAGGTLTVDEIVFAEKGDLQLLGARTLEGLNLRVDAAAKRLVAAGPILAAIAQPSAGCPSTGYP